MKRERTRKALQTLLSCPGREDGASRQEGRKTMALLVPSSLIPLIVTPAKRYAVTRQWLLHTVKRRSLGGTQEGLDNSRESSSFFPHRERR
jgi:hypothetical protein